MYLCRLLLKKRLSAEEELRAAEIRSTELPSHYCSWDIEIRGGVYYFDFLKLLVLDSLLLETGLFSLELSLFFVAQE